ncbi:DUF7537 family lipoprotein [Haloprofundus salinisoli]|uniref:DUF7537 family lipoprotein n=1 Tax=Haloprofundus salinisoli TaxID=2876193 RepID=UPI001CCD8ADB|nr:hypothetical protein [Haloprofundus salinisoli]
MPSKLAPLAVVALLLLSGCGGFLGESTPTPSSGKQTEEPAKWLAPGLTSDGVTDAEALASTHRRSVESQSRTAIRTQTFSAENETVVANTTTVIRMNGGRGPQFVETRSHGPTNVTHAPKRSMVWYNPKTSEFAGSSESKDRAVHYTYHPERDIVLVVNGTYSDRLYSLFTLINTSVDPETVSNSVHRLEGSKRQLRFESEQLRNVTFTARVDYTGVVRSYELRYETERDGMPVQVTERVRITNLGTTEVERPEWVETAKNQEGQSTSADELPADPKNRSAANSTTS